MNKKVEFSEFQQQVYIAALSIPIGQTRTYKWIAQKIGKPNAVRAVGTALRKSPYPLIIPCHRVIKSDGSLGKYAGKDERWGLFYYAGILFAEPLVEAIKRCGRDLTREKLVAVLEKMQNFKGIMANISYKPFDPKDPMSRLGQKEVFLQQCMEGGKSKILTDWVETEYIPAKSE